MCHEAAKMNMVIMNVPQSLDILSINVKISSPLSFHRYVASRREGFVARLINHLNLLVQL